MPTAMESVFTGSITIDGEQVTVRRTAGGEVWLTQLEIARLFGIFEAAVPGQYPGDLPLGGTAQGPHAADRSRRGVV